jgi:glucose-1-phosphate cytidylyltransferase
MLPIGNWPILWHIMKIYAMHGHTEFILCLGYKGEIIKDFFRNYLWRHSDVTLQLGHQPECEFHHHPAEQDWKVTLADTGEETMTAGRIQRIEPYLEGDDEFLLTYGDGVADLSVNATVDFHRKHGRTLTLTAVHPPGRFGELSLGTDGAVAEFKEKPPSNTVWINGGFFVASRRLLDYLKNGDNIMLEREPMRRLAEQNQLMAYRHDGFWQPMDTYQELTYLNQLWADGNAPWKIW